MPTTATLHVHPKVKDPIRIFEVRKLAHVTGCAFVTTKPKPQSVQAPALFNPNDGGDAA